MKDLGESNVGLVANPGAVVRVVPSELKQLRVPDPERVWLPELPRGEDADRRHDDSVVGRLLDVDTDLLKHFVHRCDISRI